MTNDFNPLSEPMRDGPIPPVDPADLRSVWAMAQKVREDLEKRYPNRKPNETVGIDIRSYKSVCSPGADVGAVWYRLSMLGLLQTMSKAEGPTLPGLTDRKPSDAFFKALAVVPMTGIQIGVVSEGLPFDPEELVRLIKEAESTT